MPGPASSNGRAFAYYASDPSLNTGRTSFAPVAEKTRNLNFSEILFERNNWTTANFNSLDYWQKKEYVTLTNWPVTSALSWWMYTSYYSTKQLCYTILATSRTTKAQDPRIGERRLQVPLRPRQDKRPQVRGL